MDQTTTTWGIHTHDYQLFLAENVIAIGWIEFGNLREHGTTREEMNSHYAEAFPDAPKGAVTTSAGQLYRFSYEAQEGDYVIYPSRVDRMINIGKITSDYYYEKKAEVGPYRYVNRRKVKWLKHVPRDCFSQGALYELGSAMSFFKVKTYASEFLSALEPGFKGTALSQSDVEPDELPAMTDFKEMTKDFIINRLATWQKGYALEGFIADLLHAMGYDCTISPQGGDHGIDIIAYKDDLPPRVVVQVKSGRDDIKEDKVQSLNGLLKEGDYGIFVTLTNYKKNARKFIEDHPRIKGINGADLTDLIMKYYDGLSDEYKALIPLERAYIPRVDKE